MLEHGKTYAGGCLCEKIRYTVIGPSIFETQCCCKDCQKATGTGHTTIVGIHRSQLRVEGNLATYTSNGESGGSVTRHFCGTCGGRLYTSGTLPGEIVMIQAGSLDEPNVVTPSKVIYHRDAVAWDHFKPGLPVYDKSAPLSAASADARNGAYRGPRLQND